MSHRLFVVVSLFAAVIVCMSSCRDSVRDRLPLQVVFTNDSHSAVDPVDGVGGFEARSFLLDSLRSVNPNLLVLDAGDMWQGSPYFNMFHGRVEVEGYNIMGYDVVTLGNHEFDFGMDTLAQRIKEMKFPVVCANYDVSKTPLDGLIKPYVIVNKGEWKIGVIGIGVNPKSLVLESNCEGVVYHDPVEAVNRCALQLRAEGCDVVIVLSHLGLRDGGVNCTDDLLAFQTVGVDLILGGHTHQFHGVYKYANQNGDSIAVIQERKSGKSIYCITLK